MTFAQMCKKLDDRYQNCSVFLNISNLNYNFAKSQVYIVWTSHSSAVRFQAMAMPRRSHMLQDDFDWTGVCSELDVSLNAKHNAWVERNK